MINLQTNIINEELKNNLRLLSIDAEKNKALLSQQLEIIYKEKWFKIFVPQSLGGLELSLLDGLLLEEELAYIDGSLGWTITLCSGASMFAGYMNHEIIREIFKDKKVCFGGSGKSSGIAKITDDGFEVSGKWDYATGTPHCTIFTANCQLEKDGQIMLDEQGKVIIQSFFFYRNEVKIYHTWNTMGLIATASHSFEIKNLRVNQNRTFSIDPLGTTLPQPVFKYPFLQFAETTIAVNTLGMTRHFLEACSRLFKERLKSKNTLATHAIIKCNRTMEDLYHLKNDFYALVSSSYQELNDKKIIELPTLEAVSIASRKLVKNLRNMAHDIFPYCGIDGANQSSEINKIWRDLFTASQHNLLLEP